MDILPNTVFCSILSLTLFNTSFLIFQLKFSTALDTIAPSQSLSDGKTLVSREGSFELGFFSPGISKNRYLGIWYKNIPVRTVLWVANRRNPIEDSSGLLTIDNTANLLLVSNRNVVVWSSNSTIVAKSPIVLQLLDSGNLVLRDEKSDSGRYLWQSFDHPSDTLIPGMKLGWDLRTGLERRLSSWRSSDDPSPGDLTWGIKLQNNPETIIWRGSQQYFRSGPWTGIAFTGAPELVQNPVFKLNFVSSEDEVYLSYNLKNISAFSRIVVNQTTNYREAYTWNEATQTWVLYASVPRDSCDNYASCGANGNCIINDLPICRCLKKFKPKSPEKWNLMDWSDGCVHNKPLNCQKGDGFVKYLGLKWPDATHSWLNKSMNLNECRAKCLQNCSCMAYSNSDVRGGGSGCIIWYGDLIDIRQFPAGGQELYIRMNPSESDAKAEPTVKIAVIVSTVIAMVSGLLVFCYCICKRKEKCREMDQQNDQITDGENEDLELPQFEFAKIVNATNNFSIENKLGQGGFGPVYKGTLEDGQEIAVKRLSMSSGQGLKEFKNEVILINKLQHRNLVKLLGCSIQREERLLVYEYMPNKSLDSFLFDQTKSKLLDWSKRFNIICGIARGLLYLHQDSRLRIIHRDLKSSNVLLDKDMNPKISDFGLARTFGGDQTEGNTSRVVGTYGYMAPEYATDGLFSVKSDVFSFGIMLLEIVTGKKSRGFYHPDNTLSLIGYAWKLWKEGKPLELVDGLAEESWNLSEVMKCIHISLLCVQQYPEDRPSMASVVLMLGGERTLPKPKEPGFFKDRGPVEAHSSSSKVESSSTNEISTSVLEPR